jgi:asparagine synthase (glutamine-hydrolysing)
VSVAANGFADFHLTRGDDSPPTRLGTPWITTFVDQDWTLRIAAADRSALVATARAGDWSTWVLGDLLSYRGDPQRAIERFAGELASGRCAASELNGSFAAIALDHRAGEWHVWSDRLATLPVYLAGDGADTVVTTFFRAAAGDGDGLDRLGMAGLAQFGLFPGDRTWVDGVRALRPATTLAITADGAIRSEERYWQWSHHPRIDRHTNEVLAAFDEGLAATIDDHARLGRLVVPLSGGLDSRTVFAVATRDHPGRVAALSYGYWPSSPEIRIPRAIAASRNVALRELVVPEYLMTRLDDVLDSVEGFGALSLTRQVGALDEFAALGDRIVGAHWGDVWFDDLGGSALLGEQLTDRAIALLTKPGGSHLQGLLRPTLPDSDLHLRQLVQAELTRIPDLADGDIRLKAFKTDQWSSRWTIPGTCAYRAALPLALPFYDNRVVDFFLTVPTDVLTGRRLQIEYLKRYHPDLAEIPWEATGRSLFATGGSRPGRLARRIAGLARRMASRTPALSRNWEVQYGSPAARAEVARRIDGLPDDVVDRVGVSSLLADWRHAPTGANGYEVDMLMTIAAMLPRLTADATGNGG